MLIHRIIHILRNSPRIKCRFVRVGVAVRVAVGVGVAVRVAVGVAVGVAVRGVGVGVAIGVVLSSRPRRGQRTSESARIFFWF